MLWGSCVVNTCSHDLDISVSVSQTITYNYVAITAIIDYTHTICVRTYLRGEFVALIGFSVMVGLL